MHTTKVSMKYMYSDNTINHEKPTSFLNLNKAFLSSHPIGFVMKHWTGISYLWQSIQVQISSKVHWNSFILSQILKEAIKYQLKGQSKRLES